MHPAGRPPRQDPREVPGDPSIIDPAARLVLGEAKLVGAVGVQARAGAQAGYPTGLHPRPGGGAGGEGRREGGASWAPEWGVAREVGALERGERRTPSSENARGVLKDVLHTSRLPGLR